MSAGSILGNSNKIVKCLELEIYTPGVEDLYTWSWDLYTWNWGFIHLGLGIYTSGVGDFCI